MATWVVGDVQGCFSTFSALFDRFRFRPDRDRLWFAGDLVNRGPDSLAMLRWAREREESVVSVLGNHDLHLLARREGVMARSKRDTLSPVLDAPDAEGLCDWLAGRPFLHREGAHLLVHAGFLPEWRLDDLERAARAAEDALRRDRPGFLRALYAIRGDAADAGDSGNDRANREGARAASVLTRIRAVDPAGRPDFGFDGPPEELPPGRRPWFESARLPEGFTVLFGHWAALGLTVTESAVCLDSGCVWGGSLTAISLDDGALTVEPAAPGDGQPF